VPFLLHVSLSSPSSLNILPTSTPTSSSAPAEHIISTTSENYPSAAITAPELTLAPSESHPPVALATITTSGLTLATIAPMHAIEISCGTIPIPPEATILVASPTNLALASLHLQADISDVPQPSMLASHPMTTRSQTGSLKPKSFSDFKLYTSTRYPLKSFHSVLQEIEPSSYSKAATDPRWRAAMGQEFDALLSNGTWTLCACPSNHNVIRNKWVYKIKQMPDGSVERFKARLVAKGFDQQCRIDYLETFSPVIKPSTIRVILSLTVQFDWHVRQLDVSNAFLHENLHEEVYMEQP
jgi:hypothetical protein